MKALYQDFVLIAAVISILAGIVLSFEEFRSSESILLRISEGHLCSATATAVVSGVLTLALKFHSQSFAGVISVGRIIVWLPIIFLELSMAQFLVGLGYWYSSRSFEHAGRSMTAYIASLLLTWIALTIWMFRKWSGRSSLYCFKDLWVLLRSNQSLSIYLSKYFTILENKSLFAANAASQWFFQLHMQTLYCNNYVSNHDWASKILTSIMNYITSKSLRIFQGLPNSRCQLDYCNVYDCGLIEFYYMLPRKLNSKKALTKRKENK